MAKLIFNFSDSFKGSLVAADLLQSEGSLAMWVDREGFVRGGLFFKVDYKDFLFIFEAKNNSLVCRRNETISVLTTEDITELKEMLFITLTWDHSKIAIYLFSGDEQKSAEVPTRPFIPPVSLIREAKKMQLLPVYEYYTEEHLRSKVYAILVSIQGKIDEYGAINPFWDITYDGSKIVTRLPKKNQTSILQFMVFFQTKL